MSVLVYTENWDGKFKKISFEIVSYASEIAKQLNTSVSVLSIGNVDENELNSLALYGADKIITENNNQLSVFDNKAYTSVLSQVAKKEDASVIVFANNNIGKALAPRLSANLKAGMAAGVVALPTSTDPFVVKKKVYSGKAFANIKINSAIKVLTLFQNAFGIIESAKTANIEAFSSDLSGIEINTEVKETNKNTGKLLLTDAEIVVSGGRGMRGAENWGPIEELAELLGAATACSRPVSDEGWRPHEEHTGQTGKVIAPNLYFACGISGAIQHLAGISASKCIVAINKDPDAPIFEAADYGIVGDAQKVLPDLVKAVKEFKS